VSFSLHFYTTADYIATRKYSGTHEVLTQVETSFLI